MKLDRSGKIIAKVVITIIAVYVLIMATRQMMGG